MTNNLHAHVSTYSRDCDGSYHRSYTTGFNVEERAENSAAIIRGEALGYDTPVNDFSDIHFMERVMMSHCSPFGVNQMTVKVDDNGVEWNEATEEGHRGGEILWCRDDCEVDD